MEALMKSISKRSGLIAGAILLGGSLFVAHADDVGSNQLCTLNTSGGTCDCPDEASPVSVGCVWVRIVAGHMPAWSLLQNPFFQVGENDPTASLYTPAGLDFVATYTIRGFSRELTAGGVPREVQITDPKGLRGGFSFKEGESVAAPTHNLRRNRNMRMMMVDAEGWATTADPAYYDLYTGDGSMYRFNAFPESEEYGQLCKYRAPSGHEEELSGTDIEIIRDDDGHLRQVLVPRYLCDVVVDSAEAYHIDMHPREYVSGNKDANGLYVVTTDAPVESWSFDNPTPGSILNLRVRQRTGTKTNTYLYTYVADVEDWLLSEGNVGQPLRTEQKSTLWNDNKTVRLSITEFLDAQGIVQSKSQEKIQEFGWGPGVVEAISDPDGQALVKTFAYDERGNTVAETKSGGGWRRMVYNADDTLAKVIRPYKDAAVGAAESLSRVVSYAYTSHTSEDAIPFGDVRPRTVTVQAQGNFIKRTLKAYYTDGNGAYHEVSEVTTSESAAYGDAANLRTETAYYGTNAAVHAIGRLAYEIGPDDKQTTYHYDYGTYSGGSDPATHSFTADPDGAAWRVTKILGTTELPDGATGEIAKQVTVYDQYGQKALQEDYVKTATGYERATWAVREYDMAYHNIEEYQSAGTQSSRTWGSNCCGKEAETSATGTETTYAYDLLKRLDASTKKGDGTRTVDVVTAHTYDIGDRRLVSTVTGGELSLVSSRNGYDKLGRIVASTNTAGIVTQYRYETGQRTTTTIRAGVTNTTESYLDGRTKFTKVNGVIKSYYDYGVNANGSQWTTVYSGPDGTNSPVWQKSTTDGLGRTILTEKPGFDGSTIEMANYYNGVGQLINSVTTVITKNDERSTQNSTLYAYNELGEQYRTAQDVNANGIIDLAGPDKVSDRYSAYEADAGGDIWRISYSVTYPLDSSSAPVTNGISRTRMTGLGGATSVTVDGVSYTGILASEAVSEDLRGNTATNSTVIDRANKTVVQVSSSPDSINDQYQVSINGITTKSISKIGIVMTYGYDALGRRLSVTDPRTGTSTTAYTDKGQVAYTTDAATNHTWSVYDPATSRRIATIRNGSPVAQASLLADSLASTPEATVASLLSNTDYSVQVSHYSTAGQLLATWGNTYPVMYAYDDYDRMSDMYTYRGTNDLATFAAFCENVQEFDRTSWQYDEATALLTNKLYAADENGVRKGTAYTYTEDGKLATRSWARGITTTYSYLPCCGALGSVNYSDDTPDVAYTYSRAGQQLTASNSVAQYTYQYDPASMALTTEIQVVEGLTNAIARTQDDLGRAVGLGLRTSPSMQEDYAVGYGYDDQGQFHQVIWGGTTATYSRVENSSLLSGYTIDDQLSVSRTYEEHRNLLIGVANTVGATQISTFDYANDPLGRRTRRLDTLNGALATTNDFSYNPRSEVIGAAMGNDAYNYDYDSIGNRRLMSNSVDSVSSVVDYSSSALNQYTNIVTDGGTPTVPAYDDDGNMLSNGDWSFAWNGENRMVQASNTVSGVVVANAYDHQGRRITKVLGGTTRIFTYDGWNMVAELTHSQTHTLTNFYVWGLDLSGSAQGAGGIGGLLATVLEGEAYFSCFDANGNLTDYVDANGTVKAHYEYGPFGGTITSTGDMADDFAYRFSTKYLDEETALYYYGFRFYDPELGRWVNRDPIGELGHINIEILSYNLHFTFANGAISRSQLGLTLMYAFGSNDPVDRFDYLGLDDTCVCEDGESTGRKQKEDWDPYDNDATDDDCTTQLAEMIPGVTGWLFDHVSDFFDGPCEDHDACYATCNSDKGDCDNDFADGMGNLCDSLGGWRRAACTAMAAIYFVGVDWLGDSPLALSQSFSDLQDAACEDCCCN